MERIGYRGCVTLLAAGEKVGKSTLMSQVAAAVSAGRACLGESCEADGVLWLALDEPLGFLVRRLDLHHAHDDMRIETEHGITIAGLRDRVVATGARLVVIDTLSEWISGTVEDSNSSDQLTPVLRELRRLAQELELAVVLLHHTGRSGEKYRGSGAIGAGVDLILEMKGVEGDPRLRRVTVRGRIGIESFAIRFDGASYHLDLDGRERSLAERILDYCEVHPGTSLRELQREIGGKAESVSASVGTLLESGQLEDMGGAKGRKLRVAGITGNHSGSTSGITQGISGNQAGITGNHSGSTQESPVIPAPMREQGKHSHAGRSGITASEGEKAA
jgi:hypothetical protein